MASKQLNTIFVFVLTLLFQVNNNNLVEAQLSPSFYITTCPMLHSIVRSATTTAITREPRMGASLLRLFYLDCFVKGCDASILLDDTSTFVGEKNAYQIRNSAHGFDVIDDIKLRVEMTCPGVVSCADILALAARDSVVSYGGPSWSVPLGRRDSRTASQAAANSSILPPTSSLSQLISRFSNAGLSRRDMVVLSGAHTIGQARCTNFRTRIYNDTNIDPTFATMRQQTCPRASGSDDDILAPLDANSDMIFDNNYFKNLVAQKGLLHSDQELFNGGSTDSIVRAYSINAALFRSDFAAAMIKMGNINVLTGRSGVIRTVCRRIG